MFLFLSTPCSCPRPRISRLAHPADFPAWPLPRPTRQQQQQSANNPLQFRDFDDFFSFSNAFLQNPPIDQTTPPSSQFTFRPSSSPFGQSSQPQVDIDTFLERFRASKALEAARSISNSRPSQQSFFDLPNSKPSFDDLLLPPPQSRPQHPVSLKQQPFIDDFRIPNRSTPAPTLQNTFSIPNPSSFVRTQPTPSPPPRLVSPAIDFRYETTTKGRKQIEPLAYDDYDDYDVPLPSSRKPASPTPKPVAQTASPFTLSPRPPPSPVRHLPLNPNDFTRATRPTSPPSRPSPLDEFLRSTLKPTSTTPKQVIYEEKRKPTPAPAVITTSRLPPPPPKPITRRPVEVDFIEEITRGPSTSPSPYRFPFSSEAATKQSQLPIEQYFTPTKPTTARTTKAEPPKQRFKASTQFLPSADDLINDDNEDNDYLRPQLSKFAASSPTTPRPFRVSTNAVTRRPLIPALDEEVVLITPPPTKLRSRVPSSTLRSTSSSTSSSTTTTTTTTTTTSTTTTTTTPRPRPAPRTRPTPSPSTPQTTRRSKPTSTTVVDQDDARQYIRRRPSSTTAAPSTRSRTSSKRRYRIVAISIFSTKSLII